MAAPVTLLQDDALPAVCQKCMWRATRDIARLLRNTEALWHLLPVVGTRGNDSSGFRLSQLGKR